MPVKMINMRDSGGHRLVRKSKNVIGTTNTRGATASADLPATSNNGQTSTLIRAKDRIQMLCFALSSTQKLAKKRYACIALKAFFDPNIPIIAIAPAFIANLPTNKPATSAAKNATMIADRSECGSTTPARIKAAATVSASSIAYLVVKTGSSDHEIERKTNATNSHGSQSPNNALNALVGRNRSGSALATKNTNTANV